MRLNIDRDLVKQLPHHLDELTHEPAIWSCDTGQWLSSFESCQLTILWMSNIKDVDLPRHAWDTPPFLLIVSPTPPIQSVDAYVRTYARSITWQPNEKRLTIFYEYGALSHERVGAPLLKVRKFTMFITCNFEKSEVNLRWLKRNKFSRAAWNASI